MDAWLQMVTDGKRAGQVESERRKAMWAVRDAVPKGGKFPVLIYAPSINNTASENADIAEFLASHGYIVIASPAVGITGRFIKKDLLHAELHAADIGQQAGHQRRRAACDDDGIDARERQAVIAFR